MRTLAAESDSLTLQPSDDGFSWRLQSQRRPLCGMIHGQQGKAGEGPFSSMDQAFTLDAPLGIQCAFLVVGRNQTQLPPACWTCCGEFFFDGAGGYVRTVRKYSVP